MESAEIKNMGPGKIMPVHPMESVAARVEWPSTYVVWDLETTGIDHKTCHIVEIGAVLVENGQIVQTYKWILDNEVEIPEEAAAIHGITNEMVAEEGRDPKQCLSEFIEVLNPGNLTHITHNGYRFDIPWLVHHVCTILGGDEDELRRLLHDTMIDTAAMVKGAKLELMRGFNESTKDYAARVMSIMAKGVKYNVTLTCEELGIDMDGITTHRAGGDVLLTNEIYKRLSHPLHVSTD